MPTRQFIHTDRLISVSNPPQLSFDSNFTCKEKKILQYPHKYTILVFNKDKFVRNFHENPVTMLFKLCFKIFLKISTLERMFNVLIKILNCKHNSFWSLHDTSIKDHLNISSLFFRCFCELTNNAFYLYSFFCWLRFFLLPSMITKYQPRWFTKTQKIKDDVIYRFNRNAA